LPRSKTNPTRIKRSLLKRNPLPDPSSGGDKDERGRVLIVGGEVELPGGVILAGIAALRAGAGKLQIATCESNSRYVGVAVPECLAAGLHESNRTIGDKAAEEIVKYGNDADAVLIGSGLRSSANNDRLLKRVMEHWQKTPLVLDAGALGILKENPRALETLKGKAVITPHTGEMASVLGIEKSEVEKDPGATARHAALRFHAVVALKGSDTYIASPRGDLYVYDSGHIGLATSGSGDTLAGIVTGLLARGASPLKSAIWGVFLHGAAGNALSERMGQIGFLARELLDEIPAIMNDV
jgi:ADP-dependent NAD(P)H-hydrate dehydratase